MLRTLLRLTLAISLSFALVHTSGAATMTVPAAVAATDGSASMSNFLIFQAGGTYKLLVDASLFGPSPVQISAISFRADGAVNSTFTYSGNLTLELSTVATTASDIENSFIDPATGSNALFVLNNELVSLSDTAPGGGAVQPFDTTITFSSIYDYDPADGNLLLNFTNFGASSNSSIGSFFDTHAANGDGVAAYVLPTGSSSAFAIEPLVAQFTLVPEPSTLLVTFLGIGGLVAFRRRGRSILSRVRSWLLLVG